MFGKNSFFGMGGNRKNVGHKERWFSTIAGAALLATALFRRRSGFGGKAAGLFGGLLMKRGLTGRCEVNQALGRNTATRFA
ncbi:MAG: DUF2892 domain-containing protein [Deltaproteobacteria bacterium]|nr:DUF2892 domain-containing protein [Deltaproteobacteria bacterium]